MLLIYITLCANPFILLYISTKNGDKNRSENFRPVTVKSSGIKVIKNIHGQINCDMANHVNI